MAWQDICCPKKEGGLRIEDVFVWNNARMMKHLWGHSKKERLSLGEMVLHVHVIWVEGFGGWG